MRNCSNYENEGDQEDSYCQRHIAARAGRRSDTCRAHVAEEIYPMWHLENVVHKE